MIANIFDTDKIISDLEPESAGLKPESRPDMFDTDRIISSLDPKKVADPEPDPVPEPEINLEFPLTLSQLRSLKAQWNIQTEHKLDPNWCLACDAHDIRINPISGSHALWCDMNSEQPLMVAYISKCPQEKWTGV